MSPESVGPQGTIDSEKRWADARRLLNDGRDPLGKAKISTPDDVAWLPWRLSGQPLGDDRIG